MYFEEANVEVSIVNGGASAHVTTPSLLPKGVADVETTSSE